MKNLEVPTSVPDFNDPRRMADLQEAQDRLNALQNLKVVIINTDGSPAGTGSIQISGDTAVLVITLAQ